MPIYHYRMLVDIHGTDVRILRDALDGEPLRLAEVIGSEALEAQIADFALDIDTQTEERWSWLDDDLAILSTYLPGRLEALEVIVDGDALSGTRHIAHRGEVVQVPLLLSRTADGIRVDGADGESLADSFQSLPGWARTALAAHV